MKPIKPIFALLLFIACQHLSFSQEIPAAQKAMALQELQNRGITEAEFRARLLQKGVDIDNVRPEQLPGLEPVIRETVAELEKEKQQKEQAAPPPDKTGNIPSPPVNLTPQAAEAVQQSAEEIGKAVDKGATLEEAISEQVADAAKQDLPGSRIYGQDIFRKQSIQLYKTVTDIKPPDSYVLGVGDEIAVSIWGASQGDFNYEINEQGYIAPAGLPRIFLKGITYGQAKKMMLSRLSQYYAFRPEQFALSIRTARTITVNIFGEVFNYGSFTISAVNTAFNALVAAGGPSDIGTLRNIQLIRNGKTTKVDVYEFLFDPKVQYNFFLENNDILFVPVAERTVSIRGAIKRPFSYELTQGEHLVKLLEYAGGLTVDAYKKSIQVQRISGDENILLDINLQELLEGKSDFELKNGDAISIRTIPGRLDNFAEISGAVDFPGKYDLTPNMRISDLLAKGVLQKETRTDMAFLLRSMPDGTIRLNKLNLDIVLARAGSETDLALEPKDKLILYASASFVDKMNIRVEGAVRSPVQHPFDPESSIRVQEAILLAGGLKPTATQFGYIKRSDISNPKLVSYLRVDVFNALQNPASADNIALQPLDVLQVLDKGTFTDEYSVEVAGSVRSPGRFQFADNLTIQAALTMAGGLQPTAAQFGFIKRVNIANPKEISYLRVDIMNALQNPASADNALLRPMDVLQVVDKTTFTDEFSVEVLGAVRTPGKIQYAADLTLQAALTMAGGLKLEAASNRIEIYRLDIQANQPTKTVFATVQVDENLNLIGNLLLQLQPFDQIVVRAVPDFELQQTVTVSGEVRYPGVYALLSKNEKLSSIIQRAGGLTTEAFPEGANITRSDGNTGPVITRMAEALQNSNSRYNYLMKNGDVISVPKAQDLVALELGATLASRLYPDKIIAPGKFNVAYNKGKRAGWYLAKYAGGIDRNARARRNLISVEHPNGEVKRTLNLGVFKITPKVRKGSIVSVGAKPKKPEKEKKQKEREPVNVERLVTSFLSLATTALTVIVLSKQL